MATVRYTPDPNKPPRMTQEEKARFDALKDENIDYTDIPDMSDVDWQRSAPKPTVTMRLDEDVVRYFKSEDPKGYTRRMAAVLTAFARQHRAPE